MEGQMERKGLRRRRWLDSPQVLELPVDRSPMLVPGWWHLAGAGHRGLGKTTSNKEIPLPQALLPTPARGQ